LDFGFNLINEIKDLIEEISKFGVNGGQNCNRLESKDCFGKFTEMQGSN
jgi:hypothetical protein